MTSEAFATAVRLRCGAKSAVLPPVVSCICPSCNGREWEQRGWVDHVHGLAALPGANATTRHDGVTKPIIHDTLHPHVTAEWDFSSSAARCAAPVTSLRGMPLATPQHAASM